MGAPDDMLMTISDVFKYKVENKPHSFSGFVCDACSEMTVEGYGRPLGDKTVCQACYDKAFAEGRA